MTTEAAVTKMASLLGQYPNDISKVRLLLGKNLRGEMTNEVSDKELRLSVFRRPGGRDSPLLHIYEEPGSRNSPALLPVSD